MIDGSALPRDGRYSMLLRKSREDIEAEKAGKYETLAVHENDLRRLADRLGITVSKVYRDLQSGDRLDNLDETMELVKDVIRGMWTGVLVIDLQRITRGDMVDQGFIMNAFLYSGTLIVTPKKVFYPSDGWDREALERDLMYGRMELHRISGRLMEGKVRRAQDGEYLGSIAPFGWKKVVVDRKKTLRPDENHDHLLQMVTDLMEWRRTPDRIAKDNNLAGITTVRGGLWDDKTVRNLCSNYVIAGYVNWNTRVTSVVFDESLQRIKKRLPSKEPICVPGLHMGTGRITKEMVDRVRAQLAAHAGSREHTGKPLRNPLAGILVCKGCGRAMARVISPTGDGRKVEGYTHPKSNKHLCHMMGSRMDVTVGAVAEALGRIAEDLELTVSGDEGARAEAAERQALSLEKSLESKRVAIANLIRLAEKGLITDEEFAARRATAEEGIVEIEARLEENRKSRISTESAKKTAFLLRSVMSSLRDYEGRAKEVNEALKQVVDRIEYEKDPETRELHLEVFLR